MLPWHLTPVAMCPVFGKYTSIDRYLTNVFFCLLFSLSAKMRLHDWYKQKSEKTSPLRLFVKDRFLFMIFSFPVLWKRMTLFCELQLQSYYIRSLYSFRNVWSGLRQRCRCMFAPWTTRLISKALVRPNWELRDNSLLLL